jgi:dienelactone hydrolase
MVTCVALASTDLWACSSTPTNNGNSDGVAGSMATVGPSPVVGGSAGHAGTPAAATSGSSGSSGGAGSLAVAAPGGHGGGSAGTGAGDGGAAGSSGMGGASGAGGAVAPPSGETGTLPAITDPAMPGHFTPTEMDNVGPNGDYTAIVPKELGEGEVKHPILIWGPGAGAWPAIYQTLLNHIASHGIVIVSYNTTPQGPELTTAIDWIVAESTRQDSMYYNKVDTTKIAMAGQSAGSLATFAAAKEPRLTATMHINGGTFDPHTDVMNLIKPALFLCGDDPAVTGGDGTYTSDLARPNCEIDFMNATVPVWYGVVIGSSHTTVIDDPAAGGMPANNPLLKPYLAATAAWLRWQLAGDQVMKALFVGPDCGFCKDTSLWLVKQKDLN